jgi:hypothetical protein
MNQILTDIEKKYDVQKLTVDNTQLWPFLRMIIAHISIKNENNVNIDSKIKKIEIIKNNFRNLFILLKKCDYIVFSDSTELKKIKGVYHNKLFIKIFEYFEKEKLLYIERSSTKHFNTKELGYKKYVSSFFFDIVSHIIGNFLFINLRPNNIEILNKIKKHIFYNQVLSY